MQLDKANTVTVLISIHNFWLEVISITSKLISHQMNWYEFDMASCINQQGQSISCNGIKFP